MIIKQTRSRLAPFFFDTLLWLGYAGFIFWLSAQPKLPAPMWFSWQDKVYHGGAYFILGVLAWRSFRHWIANGRMQLPITLLFCSVYGLSDEWHQSFVPGRSCSAADWFADIFGAALAACALSSLPHIRRCREPLMRFLD